MNDNDVLRRLFRLLDDYSANGRGNNFVNYLSPAELEEVLALDKSGAGDWESIFSWIEQYLAYSVRSSHPGFINRMWAGANLPSILGELVVALTNTSACTFESAPVSTLMERYMIDEMLRLVGFADGEGQMTTGSSNANMIAMMCARNMAGREVKSAGLTGSAPLYAFVNSEAHYSMDKAANILGIGTDRLIKVPVNGRGEMEAAALASALADVTARGGIPFFVAATAGTTVRGAYDQIEPLLPLRERYRFWLHVDGAWGGGVVMSERLRRAFLAGLEEADSFTCDFHKMLGSSLMCNFLLVKRCGTFARVLRGGDGSYLFRDTEDDEVRDLGSLSLQCGRRVDSLKWFLDWKFFGRDGFAARLEHYLQLCEYAETCVAARPELEMVSPRTSFNVCFRYRFPASVANGLNQELRTRLYRSEKYLVALGHIGDILSIRLLITNTSVTRRHVETFFDQVVEAGRELERERECRRSSIEG